MTPVEAVDAIAATGAEWSIAGVGAPESAHSAGAGGGGFGEVLADAVGELQRTQDVAAEQARALATGQAQDLVSVVTAVEQARLSMELASQVRNKAVEAYTEIFRTQV